MAHQTVVRALDISSDDSMTVSVSNESLKIWSMEAQCQRIKHFALTEIVSVKFLPRDRYVALGDKKGQLHLLDLQAGEIVYTEEDAHKDAIWTIDWHHKPEGAKGIVLITGSADGTAKFWELRQSKAGVKFAFKAREEVGEAVQWVRYSTNGRFYTMALLDNSIRSKYSDSNKLHMNFYGHKMPVLSIDISSDDVLMASASADKYIRIWGMDFGDCHKALLAHKGAVTQIKFIRDTHYMITTSRDGMVKYWDADLKVLIHEIDAHLGDVWAIAVSSIGDYFVTGGSDKILRLFKQTKELVYPQIEEQDKDSKVRIISLKHLENNRELPGRYQGQ